jgi:putative membrane protein
MGAWGWGLMTFSMLVFWGVLIAAGLALFRAWGRYQEAGPGRGLAPSDAERILAERFARGEIDEAEYRARSAALRERTRA